MTNEHNVYFCDFQIFYFCLFCIIIWNWVQKGNHIFQSARVKGAENNLAGQKFNRTVSTKAIICHREILYEYTLITNIEDRNIQGF